MRHNLYIAEVYAFRSQPDEVMPWLERAYAQKDPFLCYLNPSYRRYPSGADSRRRLLVPVADGGTFWGQLNSCQPSRGLKYPAYPPIEPTSPERVRRQGDGAGAESASPRIRPS